jgi:hypothetical protein
MQHSNVFHTSSHTCGAHPQQSPLVQRQRRPIFILLHCCAKPPPSGETLNLGRISRPLVRLRLRLRRRRQLRRRRLQRRFRRLRHASVQLLHPRPVPNGDTRGALRPFPMLRVRPRQ